MTNKDAKEETTPVVLPSFYTYSRPQMLRHLDDSHGVRGLPVRPNGRWALLEKHAELHSRGCSHSHEDLEGQAGAALGPFARLTQAQMLDHLRTFHRLPESAFRPTGLKTWDSSKEQLKRLHADLHGDRPQEDSPPEGYIRHYHLEDDSTSAPDAPSVQELPESGVIPKYTASEARALRLIVEQRWHEKRYEVLRLRQSQKEASFADLREKFAARVQEARDFGTRLADLDDEYRTREAELLREARDAGLLPARAERGLVPRRERTSFFVRELDDAINQAAARIDEESDRELAKLSSWAHELYVKISYGTLPERKRSQARELLDSVPMPDGTKVGSQIPTEE